jgi:hypothetical protein
MKLIKEFSACSLVGLILVFVAATAQAKKPNNPGGGDKGGGAVPVEVTFDDDAKYNLRSDFLSPDPTYIHEFESVTAKIDKFRLGLNVGMNGPRDFTLNLRDCISVDCQSNQLWYRGWNIFSNSPDGAQFLRMRKEEIKYVIFNLDFFDSDDRQWRIQFNPSECPMSPSGVNLSNMVRVTKTEDIPDTWVFETEVGLDVACLQLRMGGQQHHTFHGIYRVPFKITVKALE